MKEQTLARGVTFVTAPDQKFRTNVLNLFLMMPVKPGKNAARTLAGRQLFTSCRKYPDTASLTRRLHELYGASCDCRVSVVGDVMQWQIYGDVIADRFALAGEPLLREITALLEDCLFDPQVQGTAFDEKAFRIAQREQLAEIDAQVNDRRSYARQRAFLTAFEGEPGSYPYYGSREETQALTPEAVYEAYREVLRTAQARIYYAGPEGEPPAGESLTQAFVKVPERVPEPLRFQTPSPLKSSVREVTEPMQVSQSKLVLVFKYKESPEEVLRLFGTILGGSPNSLLFANVREKMHLCYYCSARVMYQKNAVAIDSGVAPRDAEKAKEAILAQVEAMRQGDFTEEQIENARRFQADMLRGVGDREYRITGYLHSCFIQGEYVSPEERIRRMEAVTKEAIVEAARTMKLDTVYLMEGQA